MEAWNSIWLLYYAGLGLFVGVIAGLFGIGGGVVLVPMLIMMFSAQQFPAEHVVHIALATTMSTIIFTSISSTIAHRRRKSVRANIVVSMLPGLVLSTLSATYVVLLIDSRYLAWFFAVFIGFVAVGMWRNTTAKPGRVLPGLFGINVASFAIGTVASLVAIGGGALIVPYLIYNNIEHKSAIGTSSSIGVPLAILATIGYGYHGWGEVDGFGLAGLIYLPAALIIAVASMLTAPIGAKLAHALPTAMLARLMAILLIGLACKTVISQI